MTPVNEFTIERMADFMQLSEDEFLRCLPDLMAWYGYSKIAHKAGAEVVSFTWYDDGKSGELHSVEMVIKETGQSEIIKGQAYTEPAGQTGRGEL